MKLITVEDRRVKNIWRCEEDSCDANPENREISIHPNWYQDNGTPVCECGCDMKYSHTEIDIENCLIP